MSSLYFEAANVVKYVGSKKGSVKSLVFRSKLKNKKALYALVCQTLKYDKMLRDLVQRCDLLKLEKSLRRNEHLAAILLYEQLLGKGISGRFKDCLKKYKASIHAQCELLKIKHGVCDLKQLASSDNDGNEIQIPRYVRVNTILTDIVEVIQKFTSSGWQHIACNQDNFYEIVSHLEGNTFTTDPHIPNLLVFPPSTDFHKHPLFLSGKIILQDKASCFPAYVLSPPGGATVIDCCAAPGNKTSHLASIINNQGTVYAFDKSKERLSTLEQLVQKAGATCIQAKCKDFLTVDPRNKQYRNVTHILVDPSCSGSGMVNRLNQRTDEEDSHSKQRLQQLSRFQISIVKHALSFPHVRQVVYSTCSIHEEENEKVVEEVISQFSDRFEMKNIMPDWSIRGVKGYEHGQCCIRMSHDQALTNGFFVACFERKDSCNIVTENESVMLNEVMSVNGELGTLNSTVTLVPENRKRNNDSSEIGVNKRDKKKRKRKRKLDHEDKSENVELSVNRNDIHTVNIKKKQKKKNKKKKKQPILK